MSGKCVIVYKIGTNLNQGYVKIDTNVYFYLKTLNKSLSKTVAGYARFQHFYGINKPEYLHRVIAKYLCNRTLLPGEVIDHIDMDKLNCTISNMRVCDQSLNGHNRKVQRNTTSGVVGVSWSKEKQKWVVRMKKGNRYSHLGYFDTVETAKLAYEKGSLEFYGCKQSNLKFSTGFSATDALNRGDVAIPVDIA